MVIIQVTFKFKIFSRAIPFHYSLIDYSYSCYSILKLIIYTCEFSIKVICGFSYAADENNNNCQNSTLFFLR